MIGSLRSGREIRTRSPAATGRLNRPGSRKSSLRKMQRTAPSPARTTA